MSTISEKADWDKQFPAIHFKDIKSYIPNPDDSIAGKGLIKKGGCTLISGPTGVGKTTFVEQLALCCASGTPFMGIEIKKAFPVLFLQAESDTEILQRDLCSISEALKIDAAQLQKNFIVRRVFGIKVEQLLQAIKSFINQHRPSVIVLDNYQSFISGDINSTQTSAEFVLGMNQLLIEYNVALVLVAHFPKTSGYQREGRSSAYSAAGSSYLPNWARASVEIHTVKNKDSVFRLEFGKNAERTGLVDDQGYPIRSCSIEHSPDQHKPYWILSADQKKAINLSGKYDLLILTELKKDSNRTDKIIGEIVGCDRCTVNRFRNEKFTKT